MSELIPDGSGDQVQQGANKTSSESAQRKKAVVSEYLRMILSN